MINYYFEEVTSTQKIALTIANEMLKGFRKEENFSVIASIQTNGIGRKGDEWKSPAGNFYGTLCFTKNNQDINNIFPYLVLISVAQGLAIYDNPAVKFKWPNDLIINGLKAGGILIDKIGSMAIVGVGLNLIFSPDLKKFNSLKNERLLNKSFEKDYLINKKSALESIESLIRKNIENYCKQFESSRNIANKLKELWNLKAYLLNEEVIMKDSSGNYIKGINKGINEKGALIISTKEKFQEFYSGSLVIT